MSKSLKVTQITDAIIAQAKNVAVQHEQYVSQFVTRGRQELYTLLSDMYAVLLSVNASKQSKQILNQMRTAIQDAAALAGGKARVPNKSATAIVVRYITRAEPKTVSVYKRVFDSAIANGIAAADLADYITASGGVDKCGKALKAAEDKKSKMSLRENLSVL